MTKSIISNYEVFMMPCLPRIVTISISSEFKVSVADPNLCGPMRGSVPRDQTGRYDYAFIVAYIGYIYGIVFISVAVGCLSVKTVP